MRSLLVTWDFPPMVGGIARMLSALWERLDPGTVEIVAPDAPGAAEFDRGFPVSVTRFPAPEGGHVAKAASFAAGTAWTLGRLAHRRPDLVVAGQIARAGPVALAYRQLTGRPYYLWVYGGETSPRFRPSAWATRHLHRVLREASRVLAVSPWVRREMEEFGVPPGRLVEIAPGVDDDFRPGRADAALVERHGLGGALVLLTVGRLVERKGIDTVMRALATLGDRLPCWRYVVVGDGPARAGLEGLARELGIDGSVTFTGLVERPALPAYYRLCDLFVMPNREVAGGDGASLSVEGFGIVFLEAAATGKPVVGGRSGGAVDAVDDGRNGLLVDPGDIDDLAAALLRLSDPATRRKMGAAGRRFAARFRWESAVARLRPLLEAGTLEDGR